MHQQGSDDVTHYRKYSVKVIGWENVQEFIGENVQRRKMADIWYCEVFSVKSSRAVALLIASERLERHGVLYSEYL